MSLNVYWFEDSKKVIGDVESRKIDSVDFKVFEEEEGIHRDRPDTPFIKKLHSQLTKNTHDTLLLILDGTFLGELVDKLEHQVDPMRAYDEAPFTGMLLPKSTIIHTLALWENDMSLYSDIIKSLEIPYSFESKHRSLDPTGYGGITYPTPEIAKKVKMLVDLQNCT